MVIKILLILALLAIVVSLGIALVTLIRDSGASKRTVRALTVRSLLSIVVYLFLFLAVALGFLRPHAPEFLQANTSATAYHQ